MNRLLLEAAYDKEIKKSPGGVYPDREIYIPTPQDSAKCFEEFMRDAQKRLEHDMQSPNEPRQVRPGEDIRVENGRVQVAGQVAVMAINGLLTKVIFDKNPDSEFYVEESFPLDWMYAHLSPHRFILKLNREPLPELSEEAVRQDRRFWTQQQAQLIGDWLTPETPVKDVCTFALKAFGPGDQASRKGEPAFVQNENATKLYSKLRSSIGGLYQWRADHAQSDAERKRMSTEADFAFREAFAFCPRSPEVIFRYVNLLVSEKRIDDAFRVAATAQMLDPGNSQVEDLVTQLGKQKQAQAK
jgi:hypothetical protein